MRRPAAWLLALVLLCGCTGEGGEAPSSVGLPTGGTLKVGMAIDAVQSLDPAKEYSASALDSAKASWELFRCCLLRTLLSYRGLPTERGGTELHPDLASAMPTVSSDGLLWTFRLKRGIRYAPPLQDIEVTAGDFVRSFLREGDPIGSGTFAYSAYYSVIQGFDEVTRGEAEAISGVAVPDPHTLKIRLDRPAGDLGYRMSLPASAPIPPNPFDPSDPMGIAQGHEVDFGRFLVGTGPYMLEGSEALDFSLPALLQPGVAGYRPNGSITLVRNPSWIPSTDDLRPALVDRIEIRIADWPVDGPPENLSPLVEAGRLDLMLDANPPVGTDPATLPSTVRLHTDASNELTYASMNLALPPFDDVHVRKAVNLVLDKQAILRLGESRGSSSRIATHAAPDSLEAGLLATWDPYRTSLAGARQEMRASRYDRDRDGLCDLAVCEAIRFEDLQFPVGSDVAWTRIVRRSLAEIGVDLAPRSLVYIADAPTEMIQLEFGFYSVRQSDYPSAFTFFRTLFSGRSILRSGSFRAVNHNFSLTGARPDQLRRWGYDITSVPSVDDMIESCQSELGSQSTDCWAALDQYLMEEVVPIVPILSSETVRLVAARVRGYSIDQFTGLPALDRISLLGS